MDMNQIVFASVGIVGVFFVIIVAVSYLAYKVRGNGNVKRPYYSQYDQYR